MTLPSQPALLFIISGPAGCGKTTLCDRMLEAVPAVKRVVTSTTRPPREGETDRVDYYFFDELSFRKKVAAGDFYEYAEVHSRFYGTLKSEIDEKMADGVDLLLNIDVQGAASFRRCAAEEPRLRDRVVTIFLMPPNAEELERRLRGRGSDAEADIQLRLKTAHEEMAQYPEYDYCLVSGDREADFANLKAIYAAEKMRVRTR